MDRSVADRGPLVSRIDPLPPPKAQTSPGKENAPGPPSEHAVHGGPLHCPHRHHDANASQDSQCSCGFLFGRSILANTVDIEEISLASAMQDEDPALFLFDFKAASPSGWNFWLAGRGPEMQRDSVGLQSHRHFSMGLQPHRQIKIPDPAVAILLWDCNPVANFRRPS